MGVETILVTSGLPSTPQKEVLNIYRKEMPLLKRFLHHATALCLHVLLEVAP